MDEHRYYGVDVKVQRAPHVEREEELSDDQLQSLWDCAAEDFWRSLTENAQDQLGVETVYSEGRGGGWAVPEPHIDPEEEPKRFEQFRQMAEQERDFYSGTVFPNLVRDELAELDAQRERNITRGYN